MRGGRRTAAALIVAAFLSVACSGVIDLDLPDVPVDARHPPEQSFVYDAAGNQLAVLRREFREAVPFEALPAHLVDAVVAAEDQRFFDHAGVDARAVARAALANADAGEVEQGGSTITQQLVKQLYMPDAERTFKNKVREAILARSVERSRAKSEILAEYLNTVYFGGGAYGVEAAARSYFRVPATELDLPRAALLAGLIQGPERLNPRTNPDGARTRRDYVLDRMLDDGRIDAAQADAARATPVEVAPPLAPPETVEPHWVDFVVRSLLTDPRFGANETERAALLWGGGLRIHTTLEPGLQQAARGSLAATLPSPADPDAAVVTVDVRTGRILAATGSRPYAELQYDLATQARRQPGSTFKTFVLAAAVAAGTRPDDVVSGDQAVLDTVNGPWEVRNYGRRSYGPITLAEATRASVNTAFAQLVLELGVGRVARLARAMGVRSPVNEDPPIALGAVDPGVTVLDLATGYATLANLGVRPPVSPIDRIEDASGAVVWRPSDAFRPVMDPSAAFVVTDMLRGVVEDGTGRRASIPGRDLAGKTGTTQQHTDAWFVGYSPSLVTAVWMGHAEGLVPMLGVRGVARVTGGTLPARIWRDIMTQALAGRPVEEFVLPDAHLREVAIDPASGLLAAPWCPGETVRLPEILLPRDVCPSPRPTLDDRHAGLSEAPDGAATTPSPAASAPGTRDAVPTPAPSPTAPAPAAPSPSAPAAGGPEAAPPSPAPSAPAPSAPAPAPSGDAAGH